MIVIDFTESYIREAIQDIGVPIILPLVIGQHDYEFDIDHNKLSDDINHKLKYALYEDECKLAPHEDESFYDQSAPVGVSRDKARSFNAIIRECNSWEEEIEKAAKN